MGIFRTLAVGLVAAGALLSADMVQAQTRTLQNTSGPAEVPPSSFTGAQYVDSRGCVFIRAGVNGSTRWVPRVNRDRTVVCGAAPSRVAEAAPAPTPTPAPAPAPVVIAPPTEAAAASAPVQAAEPVIRRQPAAAAPRRIVEPAPRTVAAPPRTTAPAAAPARRAAAPAPRRAAAPRPMPQVVRAPAPRQQVVLPPGCGASALSARYLPGCSPTSTSAQPSRVVTLTAPSVVTAPSTPVRGLGRSRRVDEQVIMTVTPPANATRVSPTAPSPRRATGAAVRPAAGACQGASSVSARYLSGASRCGGDAGWSPQQRSSVESDSSLSTTASTRAQRVVVVPAARTTFDVTHPPAGYRAAWSDGRLNPQRGPRTAQGDYQTQAIWTSTTPRRLRPIILTTR